MILFSHDAEIAGQQSVMRTISLPFGAPQSEMSAPVEVPGAAGWAQDAGNFGHLWGAAELESSVCPFPES